MAKKAAKSNGESISAYFTKLFQEHPEWVDLATNKPILDHWKQQRGADMDKKTRQIMANQKSKMRKKMRGEDSRAPARPGRKAKKRGRRASPVAPKQAVPALERLEVMIDGCLSAARALEVENIETVIRPLRQARNNIVLMFVTK
jgi:hypothetical protein